MSSVGICRGRRGWDPGLRWGGYSVSGKDVAPLKPVGKRQGGYTCGRMCGTESLRFHLDGLFCKAAERGGGRSYV